MFGRNNNTFPTPYTHSPNNGTIFNSNAFQQTNMFNFQIQNQTFNYNYNQPTQNLPNQFPLSNTNQPTNVNQPQNLTEFEQLLQESQQYSDNSLAKTSKNAYDKALLVYETVMNILKTNLSPITIEKLKVFITYQARNNIAINTLKSYITGFSYYFKTNNL